MYVYLKSLKTAEVTQIEQDLNYKKNQTRISYSIAKAKRQLLQTSITIAEIFEGFPIYFGTKIDFRIRHYP